MNQTIRDRIYYNYQYAGLTVGVFLILLVPVLWAPWPHTLLLVLLQLPAYFGHQTEEYFKDKFRLGMNEELAQGREVLTKDAVLFINIVGVWGTDLIALYLSAFVRPGLGLIAMYLALVNATVHVGVTLVTRAYNPGLYTALVLLLPNGALGLWLFVRSGQASTSDHLWSLGVGIVIHVLIGIHIYRRVTIVRSNR